MSTTKLSALACALLAAACNASETGNPVAERTMALRGRSTNDAIRLGTSADADVIVERAFVVLDDVRFEHGAQCDDGDERDADIPGPITVDLVADPAPLPLALEDDAYCRVRVRLTRAEDLPSGAPAELEDASIVLEGTLPSGTAFTIRSRREPEAEIRSRDEPFQLTQATSALILAFDIGLWLEGVDLEGAQADDDGAIHIDDDQNDDRLERFEENVERAMELFHDLDHDGTLDADDVPLASSE